MCAGHFAEILKENPFPDSGGPLEWFQWSVHVHNLVNTRLGKPTFSPEQAMERWTKKSQSSQFDFKILIIILLVLALIYFGFKLY